MKITGELLKTERIKQNLSQQDIAATLKLSPRIIQAIEDGNLENLPAKTFTRGFVKSYAEMLKLDSNLVLKQYHEEVGITQPKPKVAAPTTNESVIRSQQTNIHSVTPQLKYNLNKNTFKIVALILGLVVILSGINQIINKYQKEVKPTADTIQKEEETATAALTETPESKSATDSKSAEVEKTDGTQLTPSTANEVKVAPTDIPLPKVDPQSQLVEKPTEKVVEINRSNSEKSVELVIEALEDTTIMYAVGGETTFKTLELKKDTFQIIKSHNGLKIKTDVGSSINLTVNGINKGTASKDAKPVQINF